MRTSPASFSPPLQVMCCQWRTRQLTSQQLNKKTGKASSDRLLFLGHGSTAKKECYTDKHGFTLAKLIFNLTTFSFVSFLGCKGRLQLNSPIYLTQFKTRAISIIWAKTLKSSEGFSVSSNV